MMADIMRNVIGRREVLRGGAAVAATLAIGGWSEVLAQSASQMDAVAQMRAMGATATLTPIALRGRVTMLQSSVFGNMAVLSGPDGTLVVDSGFVTARVNIEKALTALGAMPIKTLVNTHYHFDHTDGNEWMHSTGTTIVAHTNTRKRLMTPQVSVALGMKFDAQPAGAWPTVCFDEMSTLYVNGQTVKLEHYKAAHTDSDISVRLDEANVVHMGDTFFRGFPVIDGSSGGNIRGMIAASERTLAQVDGETKIIPGHGPLGDKAALTAYLAMLQRVFENVSKLKAKGMTVEQVIAAKPTATFDGAFGHGFVNGDLFVKMMYPGV